MSSAGLEAKQNNQMRANVHFVPDYLGCIGTAIIMAAVGVI